VFTWPQPSWCRGATSASGVGQTERESLATENASNGRKHWVLRHCLSPLAVRPEWFLIELCEGGAVAIGCTCCSVGARAMTFWRFPAPRPGLLLFGPQYTAIHARATLHLQCGRAAHVRSINRDGTLLSLSLLPDKRSNPTTPTFPPLTCPHHTSSSLQYCEGNNSLS